MQEVVEEEGGAWQGSERNIDFHRIFENGLGGPRRLGLQKRDGGVILIGGEQECLTGIFCWL